MRFVPTRIHGIVDWLLGALLIALPWLLGFAGGGPETYVPVALGSIGLLVTFSQIMSTELSGASDERTFGG